MGEITVSWQTLITIAAVLTAVVTILGRYNKLYDWIKRQDEQDKVIKSIQDEQSILTEGILACLMGLKEQGCDGAVTTAIEKINKHLNQKAHGG
ncbi:MAG: branched-chain amino acid ABC transporter permease [Oscillospiraceae bacterium]|nr:branched-chain amino acid ABC transporter permease [Oscillospiraceae bacterium]